MRIIILKFTMGLTFLFVISCFHQKSFQFAWLSDTHISDSGSAAEDLLAAVKDINALPEIDFVIVSGDITEADMADNLDRAKEILDQLTMPYYIIPGNHDTKWTESGGTKFIHLWGEDKFVFDQAGFKFIGMHQGPEMRMADGHFAPHDLRWLDSILTRLKNPDQPLIMVTHYPLDTSVDNIGAFLDVIKSYNVKLVLHGHGHRNRLSDYFGIPGLMGRSSLRAGEENGGYNIVQFRENQFHFYERITGQHTRDSWATIPISATKTVVDTTRFPLVDYSVNDSFPNVQIKWSYHTGHTLAASPILAGDVILFGDASGRFYALDIKDGQERWNFKTGGRIYATAAASQGVVVLTSTDSCIYALNSNTGALIWKFPTAAANVAVPLIAEHVVYVSGSDHKFRAIELISGKLLWEYEGVKGFMESKPVIDQDKVIFTAWDETVYALNRKDGTLLWKWREGRPGLLYSPAACWPVAARGKIFIVAPDRFMTAIDNQTGQTIWRSNRFRVRETIGLSEDRKRVYARTMQDTLLAISAFSEQYKVLWADDYQFGYDIASSMIAEKDGVVYVVTKNGLILSLNGNDGRLRWKYKVGNALLNTPLPIDVHQVVLTDLDGNVFLLQDRAIYK